MKKIEIDQLAKRVTYSMGPPDSGRRIDRELARRKESEILEGSLRPDHVHVYLSIPPKYAVCQVVGFMKGKSAIHIAREYPERKRNFVGQHFWARGYFVASSGNVTDEGGATVTEKGVSWSTSQNPTVFDNTTNDGSGPGTYTSVMTELSCGTTYYVRAEGDCNNSNAANATPWIPLLLLDD